MKERKQRWLQIHSLSNRKYGVAIHPEGKSMRAARLEETKRSPVLDVLPLQSLLDIPGGGAEEAGGYDSLEFRGDIFKLEKV